MCVCVSFFLLLLSLYVSVFNLPVRLCCVLLIFSGAATCQSAHSHTFKFLIHFIFVLWASFNNIDQWRCVRFLSEWYERHTGMNVVVILLESSVAYTSVTYAYNEMCEQPIHTNGSHCWREIAHTNTNTHRYIHTLVVLVLIRFFVIFGCDHNGTKLHLIYLDV